MSLIEKLVRLRIDSFQKEFDIDINDFAVTNNIRKMCWRSLKPKLLTHKYITSEYDLYDCFLAIINIIWRNIMTYKIIDQSRCLYMYHNNFRDTVLLSEINTDVPHLCSMVLFNRYTNYPAQWNNCYVLQTKIINYIMLLDILVTENMINDLVLMFKTCMITVVLIL